MAAQPGVQRQRTILIVDDEAAVGRSLQTFLAGSLRNVRVVVETDPQTALNRLLSDDIQLVIVDQIMDGLTGTELLAGAKKMAPQTGRILVTGYADSVLDPTEIRLAEPLHVFLKPLETRPFLELLRKLLQLPEASG